MKITAEPRSDQWNADDFISGPRVFTIAKVTPGRAEQKYDIELVEGEGRAWRPPLTVLRILLAAWGDEASAWVGQKVVLYRDDSVKFGGESAPGIRVSHMTNLPDSQPLSVRATSSRGKRAMHTVQPLTEQPATPEPTAEQVAECSDLDQLRAMWDASGPDMRTVIQARVAEIQATPAEPDASDNAQQGGEGS